MTPEVHVVVIWPRALESAAEILDDLARRFRLLDVFRIEWSADRFGQCLCRFYEDSTMGPGSAKERHVGVGPFLLALVEDELPAYGRRKTSRGTAVVHEAMFDAKAQYRELTGGGHLVHGSVTAAEADRDLFFLVRRRAASFQRRSRPWDREIQPYVGNVVGVEGWLDRKELLIDLELSLPYVQLDEGPPSTVLLAERWWADVLTTVHGQRPGARKLTIPVAGRQLELVVSHVGDGSLRRTHQASLLRDRVRDASGAFVPNDEQQRKAALVAVGRRSGGARWRRLLATLR